MDMLELLRSVLGEIIAAAVLSAIAVWWKWGRGWWRDYQCQRQRRREEMETMREFAEDEEFRDRVRRWVLVEEEVRNELRREREREAEENNPYKGCE